MSRAVITVALGLALAACGPSEPEVLSGPVAVDAPRDETAAAPPTRPAPPPRAGPPRVAPLDARMAELAEGWSGEVAFGAPWDALDPTLTAGAVEGVRLFDPSDPYWGLPRTDGYIEVMASCAACHSLRIVMQQHAGPERWHAIIDWMVATEGMAPLEREAQNLLVDYLAEHFGEESAPG